MADTEDFTTRHSSTDRGSTSPDDTASTGQPAEQGRDAVHGDAQSDFTREPARTGDKAAAGVAPTGMGTAGVSGPGTSSGPGGMRAGTEPGTGAAPGMGGGPASALKTDESTGKAPLFGDTGELSSRWQSVQVVFVDEPRRAVEDADHLVTEMMDRLSELFRSQRQDLERTWHAGNEVSTEDLRVALQRYRSFFERLLAA